MDQQKTKRKLREDLTPEQKAKAEEIGSLQFKSYRDPYLMLVRVKYPGVGPKGRVA